MRDTYLTNHFSRLSGKELDSFDPPAISAEEWHRRHEAKIAAMAGEAEIREPEAIRLMKKRAKRTIAKQRKMRLG